MSINRVFVTGNLTRDAELRDTQGGTSYLRMGVAVNDRRKNPQTGEWEDVPNFVDCVMFGTRAEAIARYLTKGTKVAVDGSLRYSSWERDGQRRSKLEVAVRDVEFMSRQQQAQQQAPAVAYAQPAPQQAPCQAPAAQAPAQTPQAAPGLYDEDIPF